MARICRTWPLPTVVFAFFLGTAAAFAQTTGPDEGAGPFGVTEQKLQLTDAQRSAIYNAVRRQSLHASNPTLPAVVGAPVPPSAALLELPDETAGEPWAEFLKYAMVADDVVIVDPIGMRVVDVIHGNAIP